MDRSLKERLVGATILVVLIVLIVPELLSGPQRPRKTSSNSGSVETVRNVTVDLATSKAMPADAPAGAASVAAASPDGVSHDVVETPAVAGAPSTTSSEEAATHHAVTAPTITTLQAQQPVTGAIENGASSPKPPMPAHVENAHHNWAVQIGSFASKVNAEKLDRQLKAKGLPAFLVASGAGRELRFKVRVGPLADRTAADKMVVRLHKEGHSGSVVAP